MNCLDESLPDGNSVKVQLVGGIANEFPLEAIGVSDSVLLLQLC